MKPSHALSFLLAALLTPLAMAQDWRAGTARLEGRVSDPAGEPIAGATVALELPGRGGTTLTTDEQGRWAILGLTGGEWEVTLSAEGRDPQRLTIAVSELSRRPPLEVTLERTAPTRPGSEARAALEAAESALADGRLAEARAHYETLRALHPELSGRIDQQVGFSYIREGDYARALDALLRALAAEPDDVLARAAAVQAAFAAGQEEKGRDLLSKVDADRIHDPDILFNFGVDLLNAGATREAVAWFSRAISLDPGHVDSHYRRGLAHLQLGETAECRADLQQVVALAPESAEGQMAARALTQVEVP